MGHIQHLNLKMDMDGWMDGGKRNCLSIRIVMKGREKGIILFVAFPFSSNKWTCVHKNPPIFHIYSITYRNSIFNKNFAIIR